MIAPMHGDNKPGDSRECGKSQSPKTSIPVFEFAGYLGERFGCTHILDIDCGGRKRTIQLPRQFEVVEVDLSSGRSGLQLENGLRRTDRGLEHSPGAIPVSEDVLRRTLIVCADLPPGSSLPVDLLLKVRRLLDHAPVCITTASLNEWLSEYAPLDAEAQPHLSSQALRTFEQLLLGHSFNLQFVGLTTSTNVISRDTMVAIIERNSARRPPSRDLGTKAESDLVVVAIVTVYNEEDIVVPSIDRLVRQGIGVYVVDTWSTDATYALVEQFRGRGLVGVERFPKEGPANNFELKTLLRRVEKITEEIKADWFIHHDVDEVRVPPWSGVDLRSGILAVDRAGFNCIDHTLIVFHPVDNGFIPGSDFERYFRYYEFGRRPGHFLQMKTWKNTGQKISLAESGGHDVRFEGKKVYPYKFLLKHYPIRSQKHGDTKVFRDRLPRFSPAEKAIGMHVHYSGLKQGHRFLRSPSELEVFDEQVFNETYLLERLSGIGLLQNEH
jgi:hypothetical protein